MEVIYGRNPVYETLRASKRRIFRLFLSQRAEIKGRLQEIVQLCEEYDIPIERVPRQRLDKLADGHQGVGLETDSYIYSHISEILNKVKDSEEAAFILILDTLQDPQNLGTLLRTAEAAGVHGIILPSRRTATVTPAVVSASSGASEHLLIAQANLAQTITTLKSDAVWVIGLERSPDALPPDRIQLGAPLALVVGSEAKGMRPLVRKSCDQLMQLPMRGDIASLNAAVAGSIALYLTLQRRASSN